MKLVVEFLGTSERFTLEVDKLPRVHQDLTYLPEWEPVVEALQLRHPRGSEHSLVGYIAVFSEEGDIHGRIAPAITGNGMRVLADPNPIRGQISGWRFQKMS